MILPDSNVYVFGSIVKGEATGRSDIDILIISKNIPKNNIEKAEIKMKIEKLSNLPLYHPFEFHLVNDEEAEWYFKRIKELKEISYNLFIITNFLVIFSVFFKSIFLKTFEEDNYENMF